MNNRGFTLLEVLVSIAIFSVLISVLMSFVSSTNTSAARGAQQSQALRELQTAAAIIADDVRLARLIYPAAQSLTLGSTAPATVTNPDTGTNVWETKPSGSFFAMILPVDASNTNLPCAGVSPYEFVAYYLIRRSRLTGLPLSDWGNPGPDPENDSTFVLMRYGTCVSTVSPLPTSLSGGEGRLVVDYLETAGMNISSSQVTVSMEGLRTIRGYQIRVPAAGSSPDAIYVTAAVRNRR